MKTRVEKLCQAFETGKELVELSQALPHDISNVLKLYLRQVRRPGGVHWKGRGQSTCYSGWGPTVLGVARVRRGVGTGALWRTGAESVAAVGGALVWLGVAMAAG